MDVVDTGPFSLATFILVLGAVGAGMSAMSRRWTLAIALALVALAALAGMVVWTLLP